jgi:hypothetical protein
MAFTLLQHHYYQQVEHPAYQQMMQNIRAHNEERAEMSLSILAYSVAGDADRSSCDKLDMNYTILNRCRTLIKEVNTELATAPPIRFQTNTITNAEVAGVAHHMQGVIIAMAQGTWEAYTPNEKKYIPTSQHRPASFPRYLARNASLRMHTLLTSVRRLLLDENRSFQEQLHLVYPAVGPQEVVEAV